MEAHLHQLIEQSQQDDADQARRDRVRKRLQVVLQITGNLRKKRHRHKEPDQVIDCADRYDHPEHKGTRPVFVPDPSVIVSDKESEGNKDKVREKRKIALGIRYDEQSKQLAQKIARGRLYSIIADQ